VASINVGGGGSSLAVTLSIVIFIIALAYILFIRNPNFLKNLLGKSIACVAARGTTMVLV
jgi:hypothetical protein